MHTREGFEWYVVQLTCNAVVLQHCSKPQRQICSSCLLRRMCTAATPAWMRLQPRQGLHILVLILILPLLAW